MIAQPKTSATAAAAATAINQPFNPVLGGHLKEVVMASLDACTPVKVNLREVRVPTFSKTDPTQPGVMSTISVSETAADVKIDHSINQPQQTTSQEKTMNAPIPSPAAAATTSFIRACVPDFFANAKKPEAAAATATPAAPVELKTADQIIADVKATVNAEAAAAAAPKASAEDTAKAEADAVAKAQAAAKRTNSITKGLNIFGALMGFGAVTGGAGYGVFSAKAAEAAAADAAATAVAGEVAAATVAETVVVGETVAATGFVARTMAFTTGNATLVGLTLPVWGWAAAAVGVAAAGYGVYRFVNRGDKKAAAPAAAPAAPKAAAEGVTAGQAVRAVAEGFGAGAVATAAVIGTGYLVGSMGAAMIGKSVATFGTKYGIVIAIGGAYTTATVANTIISHVQYAYASKRQQAAQAAANQAANAATAARVV